MGELKAVINVLTETLIQVRIKQSSMTLQDDPELYSYLQGQIDMLETVIKCTMNTFESVKELSTVNSQ